MPSPGAMSPSPGNDRAEDQKWELVGTFAHNNRLVFIGDPNAISDAGKARRLEHLISLTLKFGTTDFIRPHPDQNIP